MDRLTRLVTPGNKLLFVAVVAVVIPSIILAGFGLKFTRESLAQTEQLVTRAYQAATDSEIDRILSRVQDKERKLLREASLYPVPALLRQLRELPERYPIADRFFLLNAQRDIVYPETRPDVIPEPIRVSPGPGGRGAERLLASGYQLEFQRNNVLAAANKYRRGADGPFRTDLRVEALTALGGAFTKLERYKSAITAYQRIAEEFDEDEVPLPYRLLAKFQICRAQAASNQKYAAIEGFLSLYESLISRPVSVSGADCIEFFRQSSRSSLVRLLSSIEEDNPYRLEFLHLKELDDKREEENHFRSELSQWLADRLEVEAKGKPAEPKSFYHFQETIDGRPEVYAFVLIAHDEGQRPSILGFRMNLKYVKESIIRPIVQSRHFRRGTSMGLVDASGRTLIDSVAGQEGERTEHNYALLQPFPAILDFWKIGIQDRDNVELQQFRRNQFFLMASILGLTVATLVVGLVITLRGITRQLELSRLKSDFVSNVSHELKTPLALIRMFGETLLLGRIKSKEKAREYYEVITRESERLTHLIDNVLDFSKIESGRKEYEFELADVVEIVNTTLDSYRERLESQGFSVQVDLPEEELLAKVDESAIFQAILNLLSNARKYSGERKEIAVSVQSNGTQIRISIADRGIGIPETDQEQIFEKFHRVNNDQVRSVRGSGLGLAITHHTIEAHGGHIELESTPGEGSTFTLVLPQAEWGEEAERDPWDDGNVYPERPAEVIRSDSVEPSIESPNRTQDTREEESRAR